MKQLIISCPHCKESITIIKGKGRCSTCNTLVVLGKPEIKKVVIDIDLDDDTEISLNNA